MDSKLKTIIAMLYTENNVLKQQKGLPKERSKEDCEGNHQNEKHKMEDDKKEVKYSTYNLLLTISILAILLVSLAILVVALYQAENIQRAKVTTYIPSNGRHERSTVPTLPPTPGLSSITDLPENTTLPAELKIVLRAEWIAQPQTEQVNKLNTSVPYVIIMHTATQNCSSQAECTFHVRFIQMFHMENNHWWDIGYNFLVGGDGYAYEGRGWESEGAHTYGYNKRSIGIAFIGTFSGILPTPVQMTACKQLIEKGVELGYISKQYKLLAARQLQSTESPGAMLYEEIKKWPHWSPSPKILKPL